MRKLFWCCAAAAVAVAGTVYLAAKHVEQHPYEVLGQTVLTLCGGNCSRAAGEAAPCELSIPSEPAPVEMQPVGATISSTPEVVAVADPVLTGHIVVSQQDSSVGYLPPDPVVGSPCPMTGDDGCVAATIESTVPALMPYCSEDRECPGRMPYAEEDGCQEEQGSLIERMFELIRDCVPKAVEPTTPTEPESLEESAPNTPATCPQGHCPHDYHHPHCPVCPYTGRSYPSEIPHPACPVIPESHEKNTEDRKNGECPKSDCEEKKNPAPEKNIGSEEPQYDPPALRVDTMEFRPSDAGFHRFIPGAL